MLQEITENDKSNLSPLTYPLGNGIHFQPEVDNIDDIYNYSKNNYYKMAFYIEINWYRQENKLLGNKEFLVQDSHGYLLKFSQDIGEKNV